MALTFAFDVYGTLIDPHAVGARLRDLIGDRAPAFSAAWRAKQLEYSFRRSVMQAYRDFSVVTAEALDTTCEAFAVPLATADRDDLLSRYRRLDAFEDAQPTLRALRDTGCAVYAFSNGRPDDLEELMHHAGLDVLLDGVVSVHDVGVFKPDARVYNHFNQVTNSPAGDTWLVSGNPFDISGAQVCGWCTAWVQRDATTPFDAWTGPPRVTLRSLREIESLANRVS